MIESVNPRQNRENRQIHEIYGFRDCCDSPGALVRQDIRRVVQNFMSKGLKEQVPNWDDSAFASGLRFEIQ